MSIAWNIGPRRSKLARTNEALLRLGGVVKGIRGDIEKKKSAEAARALKQAELDLDREAAQQKVREERGRALRATERLIFEGKKAEEANKTRLKVAEIAAEASLQRGLGRGTGTPSKYAEIRGDLLSAMEEPWGENHSLYWPFLGIARKMRDREPNMTVTDQKFPDLLWRTIRGEYGEVDDLTRGDIASFFMERLPDIDDTFLRGVPPRANWRDIAVRKIRSLIPFVGGASAESTAPAATDVFQEIMSVDEMLANPDRFSFTDILEAMKRDAEEGRE